ncbi:GIY-YIG nuclease family protein [Clostridium weizhouense]|uniref:GIY-YIG nuclease family protein n=1 Tax=Clostridium weizhouense TaxID=2859781 RepID=A0ABS7AP56_9CLOT|nr:GIY-YIG nuclease family protein [Clostridium weizhouense]MBW6410447.1 GIY-YIG nuclease family protein [Clostridium weizhouense]
MNYVYIVECSDGTFYTGWTVDLEKRIKTHSSGKGAKYTRGRGPVKLLYYEKFNNKSDAMKRECEIKKLNRKQKEILIKKYRE